MLLSAARLDHVLHLDLGGCVGAELALRDGRHVMLLHATRACRQVDLVEVQRDVRARILAMTLRIIELMVVLHALAAATGARLEVVGLVAGR